MGMPRPQRNDERVPLLPIQGIGADASPPTAIEHVQDLRVRMPLMPTLKIGSQAEKLAVDGRQCRPPSDRVGIVNYQIIAGISCRALKHIERPQGIRPWISIGRPA